MSPRDTYSQPDAPDPVLPDELVLELARGQLPNRVQVSRVTAVDESGGEARAYVLDAGVVVKVQRPHRLRPRTSLRKEARLLEALVPSLPGRIPMVFGYDAVATHAGAVEFIVMSRVVGEAVRNVTVTPAGRRRLLGEVADVLRAVHALDAAPLGDGALLPADDDGSDLRQRLELAFADLVAVLERTPDAWTLRVSPQEVAARAVAAIPDEWGPAVVLHSNPGPTHVFVEKSGTFTGVIDFGDAYRSHRALDLRSWPDPADRVWLHEAYLDGDAPTAEFERVWTVAMLHADLAAIAGRPSLATRAGEDILLRLAWL